jgi:hypothetical protein
MDISSLDRLNYQRNLGDVVHTMRRATLCIPTLTPTSPNSFDSDTQSGLDTMSGTGTGRTATWTTYDIQGFIQKVDHKLFTFGSVPPGVEIGDMVINIRLQDKDVFDQAYGNEHHYIIVDGETFHITATHLVGIGQVEERTIVCKKYSPTTFRCAGY